MTTATLESKTATGSLLFLVLISLVAATGGLLFGFDTAVISGTVGFFRKEFELSAAMTGWVASSALVGCMIGAAVAGVLSDRYGRKKILILSAICFTLSAIGCGLSHTVTQLVSARLLGGVGIGIASILSPLYIAEISPPKIRGRLVALQQLAIVSGILAAFFTNSLVLSTALSDPMKWRWMFGIGAFPALIFWLLLLPVPESPRWLTQNGQADKARGILVRIVGDVEADREMSQISEVINQEEGTFGELFKPGLRKAMVIGVLLAVFQQITGINAIMYFAPEIFKQAGSGAAAAFNDTVWIGLNNVVFTLISMTLVDRFGRKPLLVWGSASMGIALLFIGYAFHTGIQGIGLLALILAYVASFSVSMGVVVWVMISEIFPTRTRGRAMSLAIVVLWGACYLVSQTFLVMVETLGSAKTFWIYAAMCAVTIVFTVLFVPETKGRSLEEIEKSW
jgi:sugar porter (SP) family MFS transporter